MLSDIDDKVVCTVGQTDAHSSPDHTTRRVDVEWNSLGPQATLLMHPSGPISPSHLPTPLFVASMIFQALFKISLKISLSIQ